jgi:putative transposase
MFIPTAEQATYGQKETRKAIAAELVKGLKTEADFNQFSRMLTQLTVETAFNTKLTATSSTSRYTQNRL